MGVRYVSLFRLWVLLFIYWQLFAVLNDVELCVRTTSPARPLTTFVYGVEVTRSLRVLEVFASNDTALTEQAPVPPAKDDIVSMHLMYTRTLIDWSSSSGGKEAEHMFCRSLSLIEQFCSARKHGEKLSDDVFERLFAAGDGCLPHYRLLMAAFILALFAAMIVTITLCCGMGGGPVTSLLSIDSFMAGLASFSILASGILFTILFLVFPTAPEALDGLRLAYHPYSSAFLCGLQLILCASLLTNVSFSSAARWTFHSRTMAGRYSITNAGTTPIVYQKYRHMDTSPQHFQTSSSTDCRDKPANQREATKSESEFVDIALI